MMINTLSEIKLINMKFQLKRLDQFNLRENKHCKEQQKLLCICLTSAKIIFHFKNRDDTKI